MKKELLVLSLTLTPVHSVVASNVFSFSGIENIQWLELTETANMSRISVEAELGSGGLFDGWRYATRTETETLYDNLWGGTTEGWSTDNYNGAQLFFDTFGISDTYAYSGNSGYSPGGNAQWQAYFGESSECGGSSTFTCTANIIIEDVAFGGSQNLGYFLDENGLSTGIDAINSQSYISKRGSGEGLGSHLVRDVSAVPIPASIWLLGSGFIGLTGFAKRKTKTSNTNV